MAIEFSNGFKKAAFIDGGMLYAFNGGGSGTATLKLYRYAIDTALRPPVDTTLIYGDLVATFSGLRFVASAAYNVMQLYLPVDSTYTQLPSLATYFVLTVTPTTGSAWRAVGDPDYLGIITNGGLTPGTARVVSFNIQYSGACPA